MSRKEDLVFLKIAIANGLLTQDAAQKAIALCDKREIETGRRPLIGAVLTKYKLLRNEDVRKIYAAVEKRLGTPSRAQVGAAPAGRKGARRRAAKLDPRSKPARPIDPQTLWLGIGGMVAFVAILGVIVALLISSGERPGKASSTASSGESAPAPEPPKLPGAEAPGATSAAVSKAAPAPKPVSREIPEGVMLDLDQTIAAALDLKYVDPERGLASLERAEQQLREKGYEPPAKLLERVAELREAVKEAGGGAGEAKPGEGKPEGGSG